MASKYIKIKGAKEHNLKKINVNIPRDKFTVVTGLSGSDCLLKWHSLI